MKRIVSLPLILGLVAPLMAGPPANFRGEIRNGKPVYIEAIMNICPSTFEGMFTTADDVLEVHITARAVKAYGEQLHVRTYYTARIEKIFKGGFRPGASVTFSQFTGELELSYKILHSAGRDPIPVNDDKYIIFLRNASPELGDHTLVGDIEGVFRIKAGRVDPLGTFKVAEEQRHIRAEQFEDELNRVGRRGFRPKV
jgi:hypothetical protein